MPLSNAEFARQAAYLAKNSSHWAGDSMMLSDRLGEPVREEALQRFLSEMRERLDLIEDMAKEEGA